MLQSIRLTLQSHKNSLVEFHPGVNYIIGRSRQGKTAILRALVKVVQNRPVQGMERWTHRHNPKNISQVEVVTSEGHCVTWEGTSPQRYIVDGEEMSGFGQGVPQAVTDALRLGELNIAGQHDRPFLLFDTPGEVARALNRVVKLDVIDRTLANHAAIKRKNDQELKAVEARITELEGQAEAFPDLEAGAAKLTILEDKAKTMGAKVGQITGLTAIQEQLAVLRASLEATRIPDGVPESVDWLMDQQKELEAKVDKFRGLHRLNGDIRDHSIYIQRLEPGLAQQGQVVIMLSRQGYLQGKVTQLRGLTQIEAGLEAERDRMELLALGLAQDGWISEFLTKQNHLEAKRRHIARLQALNDQIAGVRATVAAQGPIIIQMEAEIKDEFGNQCPLCGQELSDENYL
jgi:hypothetical protein